MTEVRVLLGVLGVLLLLGFAAGCGLVSDQTKQEAKKKVEAKGQQAKQEAKKKVEAKGQQVKQEVKKKVEAGKEDLKKKVDDLQKKVEAGKEDLEKKVDDVQKDINRPGEEGGRAAEEGRRPRAARPEEVDEADIRDESLVTGARDARGGPTHAPCAAALPRAREGLRALTEVVGCRARFRMSIAVSATGEGLREAVRHISWVALHRLRLPLLPSSDHYPRRGSITRSTRVDLSIRDPAYRLLRIYLPRRLVRQLPVKAPNSSGWHHAHGVNP